jgi:hypothetical protein
MLGQVIIAEVVVVLNGFSYGIVASGIPQPTDLTAPNFLLSPD